MKITKVQLRQVQNVDDLTEPGDYLITEEVRRQHLGLGIILVCVCGESACLSDGHKMSAANPLSIEPSIIHKPCGAHFHISNGLIIPA